jgi:uncharacterized protein (DUF1330 family)
MKTQYTVALAMFAGFGLGTVGLNRLHAQSKAPGAYLVVDISEITDPELFKQIGPKAAAANASAGGHYIVRTDNVTALSGTAPKRFVVIGYDSIEKAKAAYTSPAQKEVNAIADKSMKARSFIVEGM